MKHKGVVYTCITGGYDDVPEHKYINPNWDYILFTDNTDLINKGHINQWAVRSLVYNESTNVKNARYHKVNAHKLFPEYEYSLWLDANISVNNENIFYKCDKYINNGTLIAVPKHPERDCIYDESKEIIARRYDLRKTINQEIRVLKNEKYPKHNGLSETCILFRRHNDMSNVMDLWWEMIKSYSKRDQLSFNFVLWHYNMSYTEMYNGDHRTNGDFDFIYKQSHNSATHNFKIFSIQHTASGRIHIYCCGIKIISYRVYKK